MALFARQKEEFLRKFLKPEGGLPSHHTFSRIFRLLDPEQFRACFQRFTERFAQACQGGIAIDGKVVRRSFDKASQKSALHMVSAWGCDQRGNHCDCRCLNCQREIAQQILDQGGNTPWPSRVIRARCTPM